MAENEPLTPEKQLLKLIENPKQEALQAESAKRTGKRWFSGSALLGKLAFWKAFGGKRPFPFKRTPKISFGIRQINLVITFGIVIFGTYAVYGFAKMGLELQKVSNLKLASAGVGVPAVVREAQPEGMKDLTYYADKIISRNVFSVVKVKETEKQDEEKGVGDETAEEETKIDRSKDFRLVGIAWSSNPEAMIEDVKNKRTYFVKRGQPIDAEVQVVSVLKDRVVLRAGDKEFEL